MEISLKKASFWCSF